jgi:hypothetical protein
MYRTLDGARFQAGTARQVVIELRRQSFQRGGTLRDFMREVASAARIQKRGARVPTNSPEAFVRGLVRTKLLFKIGD